MLKPWVGALIWKVNLWVNSPSKVTYRVVEIWTLVEFFGLSAGAKCLVLIFGTNCLVLIGETNCLVLLVMICANVGVCE